MTRIHFNTVDSTNTWAKEHIQTIDPNVVVCVSADEQTAGRGQFGRQWVSPKGQNLYATFCFSIPEHFQKIHHIGLVSAVIVARVFKSFGLHPEIKWPNDILINQKKCAGILCEIVNNIAYIGIGINVKMNPEILATIDQSATSLHLEVEKNCEVRVETVLTALVNTMSPAVPKYLKSGIESFSIEYNSLFVSKDTYVKGKEGEGFIKELLPDGRIRVQQDNGNDCIISWTV